MEKVFRRKNAVDQMPSESQRVMSYMNSLDSGMLRQVNDALSRDKIKQEDVTWTIATTYAVDVEVERNMGYEWGSSRKQRPVRSDDDDGTQDVPAPRRKRNNRKNKRSSAVVGAVGAASGAADKDRGEWTATEKSAIRRYAKEKMKLWNEVTFKEVAASPGGITGWSKKVGEKLTPEQRAFWTAQDDQQRADHQQEQKKPAAAQARPAVKFRKPEAQVHDTSESESDSDNDGWRLNYPVVVLDRRHEQREAAIALKRTLETADVLAGMTPDECRRTAARELREALEQAELQVSGHNMMTQEQLQSVRLSCAC
jgi:hypothetical protein